MNGVTLRATCDLSFVVTTPTTMVFMLRPQSSPTQWIAAEEYHLTPTMKVTEHTDSFGNLCQRLVAPVGNFSLRTCAQVHVSRADVSTDDASFIDVSLLPEEVLGYLLPSRYCESDRFGTMALEIVADERPGYAQVQALSNWVRENIRYVPLSSTYPVSATEVNARGEGVCRDLAHVAIAMCRALCIPARLVVGYLYELDPMDSHAWFEAYVGGHWHTFDPTFNQGEGWRIAVARGRDAADVAVYNQYGPLLLPESMRVSVEKL